MRGITLCLKTIIITIIMIEHHSQNMVLQRHQVIKCIDNNSIPSSASSSSKRSSSGQSSRHQSHDITSSATMTFFLLQSLFEFSSPTLSGFSCVFIFDISWIPLELHLDIVRRHEIKVSLRCLFSSWMHQISCIILIIIILQIWFITKSLRYLSDSLSATKCQSQATETTTVFSIKLHLWRHKFPLPFQNIPQIQESFFSHRNQRQENSPNENNNTLTTSSD